MAAIAVQNQPIDAGALNESQYIVRRFELGDLSKHGGWIVDRLLKAYPHRSQRDLMGWLRGILHSNDYLFLYQEHGCALATTARVHPLLPKPHVQEIFVFAEPGHENSAAAFYENFARWAKHHDIDTVVVQEMSDVPHELVKEKLGRVFTKQITFARL